MHGNVSEWTLDRYEADFYSKFAPGSVAIFPLCIPNELEYPACSAEVHGSMNLRSAAALSASAAIPT